MMVVQPIDAAWERGINCHGLWRKTSTGSLIRVGFIGVGKPAKVHGYGWSIDWPIENTASGRTRTLQAAKRAATRAWNETVTRLRSRKVHLASAGD